MFHHKVLFLRSSTNAVLVSQLTLLHLHTAYLAGTVSPGGLLRFTGPAAKQWFFFLGPSLKKPILQVLIQGFVEAESNEGTEIHLLSPTSGEPHICTSQQFFQSILEAAGSIPPNSIPFRVCKYLVRPYLPAVSVLLLEVGEQIFEVTERMPVRKRQKGALPFGLKMRKRRKQLPKQRAKAAAKRQKANEIRWRQRT